MKTSNEEVGPLAYADDLSVITEDPRDTVAQANKIETYCNWAGIGVNVDPIRRNKTVYTSEKCNKGSLADHIGDLRGRHSPPDSPSRDTTYHT
jgi:hypothetical protein